MNINKIDKDYIIAVSNMGIYKRAIKNQETLLVNKIDQYNYKIDDITIKFEKEIEIEKEEKPKSKSKEKS